MNWKRKTLLSAVAILGLAATVPMLTAHAGETPAKGTPKPLGDHPTIVKKGIFSGKEKEMEENFLRRLDKKPAQWKIQDGAMIVGGGDIITKEEFADYQLHVEFKVPYMPNAKGQARGNSGIGLQARYEVQVLDSYGFEKPGKGDCGAIYNIAAPLLNACKRANEWQVYDIVFRRPRFDATGKKISNATATVILNGYVVQNNQEIPGPTGIGGKVPETDLPAPIIFQDHGNKVEYRNIWILPLPDKGSNDYNPH